MKNNHKEDGWRRRQGKKKKIEWMQGIGGQWVGWGLVGKR